jgi:hypothetical protein
LHGEAAPLQEPRRIGQRERPRRRQGGIFAQRMAGHEAGMARDIEAALALQHAQRGEAHRHQRRLRVRGERQLVLGTCEHQPRQILPQRFVDLAEDIARRGESAGKLLSHADGLGALPGKDQCARHRRIAFRTE